MTQQAPFELHLSVKQAAPAIELLQQHCQLSKQQLKQVMHKGAVWLTTGNKTQRLRRAKKELTIGQELHLYYNSDALSDAFTPPQLVADLQEYSVWYKPCGMMSQGSKWGDHSTVARFAEVNLTPQRPAFIVHRLDRATHGLILIAHSKKAVRELTQLFEQRLINKKYQAVVKGQFGEAQEFNQEIDGRSAYTKVTELCYHPDMKASLVDVEIGSGRKHQIRRHLSEAGWPLIGDRLYGGDDTATTNLQLCAYELRFDCPLTLKKQHFNVQPQLIITKD
ncbi:RluA family pseudouridine synthase [Psychrobium sp. 1_MG-2023]|uniref:RluA family pseudouridine synthase n=1 Tax=Psychrobium sp. 1_MG-2023 TaxID=3062624 RepID=UPI000C33BB52|nr:RNA pseudouridine synthase [Psychrobium sp. 1_MG-2023]MDP2561352.1 RNA pseudouridine synthase [Psychrobium sp. 1_MG-2023]PKF54165.1 RNA pseudouridine synthase [Alteromonadales bacterium alter-6D02]